MPDLPTHDVRHPDQGGPASADGAISWLSRLPVWSLVVPVAVLGAVGVIADVIWPSIAQEHPLLLVAMNTRTRYLVLVSPIVDLAPFLVVAVIRSLIGDPFAYLIGQRYGDRAVDALVGRTGGESGITRRIVDLTRRASPAAVLIAPGTIVCAVVGASGMRVRTFFVCNVAGTIGRVLTIRMVGDAFSDPISIALDWVTANRLPLTAAMVVIVVVTKLRGRRSPEEELSLAETVRGLEAESVDKSSDGDGPAGRGA